MPTMSLMERFADKVLIGDDCWEWMGGKTEKGYGKKWGTPHRAHRASYGLLVGPIPEGAWVLHRCDNPGCVKPSHLYPGTPQDNSSDMVGRDRSRRGARQPMSKLTARDVREIRTRVAAGDVQQDVAREYGIGQTQVGRIHRREEWAWL